MTVYSFTKPLLKGSLKKFEITDENDHTVGFIHRFYKNKIQKYLDFIFYHSFIINVNGFDSQQNLVCEINEKFGLKQAIKSEWVGKSTNLGEFVVLDKTKIRTNPRIEVRSKNRIFRVKKDLGDKRVIFENETGLVIAEASYKSITSSRKITMNILTNDFTHIEIASLYYLLDLKD